MDFLAATTAGVWAEWLRPILLLIVGLGAVIFVHELGHFLVAKFVRIKVERFALGFGPRLFGYRGRETDYCVNLLPLGGYVKMLGQEDFKPLAEGSSDPRAFYSKTVGARFAVISAGVIMNVLFAAVLFIAVCLVGIRFYAPVVGGISEGYPAQDAVITWSEGPVDSPAAKARLQAGDEILEVEGKRLTRFQQLFVTAALADPDETFHMKIRRRTDQGVLIGEVEVGVKGLESPSGSGAPVLAFGILRPADTVFGGFEDLAAKDEFQEGDRIVGVGDRAIRHFWDIKATQESLEARPVAVTVERGRQRVRVTVHPTLRTRNKTFFLKDGTRLRAERILDVEKEGYRVRLEGGRERYLKKDDDLAPEQDLLDILGCHPRVKVVGVREGSPAEEAGLKPHDILLDYGDRGVPSYSKLVKINKIAADSGTSLVVQRDGEVVSDLWVVPTVRQDQAVIGINASVDMSGTVVGGIRTGSPAAKAGLMSDDVIVKVFAAPAGASSQPATRPATGPATPSASRPATGPATAPAARVATAPATRPGGGAGDATQWRIKTWADLLDALKQCRGRDVTILYRRGSSICGNRKCGWRYDPAVGDPDHGVKPGTALEDAPDDWVCPRCRAGKDGFFRRAHIGPLTDRIFDAGDYQVLLFDSPRPFRPLMGPEVKKGPLSAIAWGASETWLFILQTYATLRSLVNRTISHKEVIGPVGMGGVAIHVGRESITKLIYFMAMISVSLAVINFLPIPVVDGGHAVFLLIEKIRGKPVPVRVMNVVQMIGLALLLFVFVAVTWQDISRLVGNLW